MKIKSIIINNFQSYYGEHTINFSDGMNLIIGDGGKGKSKLFNAFYWVLFGKIYITDTGWCRADYLYNDSNRNLYDHKYFNEKALCDSTIGGTVECRVQLDITDDKGNEYLIERQANAIRQQAPEWDTKEAWNVSRSTLKVSYDTPTGTRFANGDLAEDKVAELFPEGIRGYIWFQGDHIDKLIDFTQPKNLTDAVTYISYYPYYEKLTSIISQARMKITSQETSRLKSLNKQNAAIKELLSEKERLQFNIQKEEENKKRYDDTIGQIELSLANDETKLSGVASYVDLNNQYNECENQIKNITNQISKIDESQRDLLPSLWVLRGIDHLVEQSKKIIADHVAVEAVAPEKKYIDEPGSAKLEEILNMSHQCFVCGSPVDDEHPHAVEWIKNRLRMQEDYYRELEDYRNNMELSKQFTMFVGKIQDYPDSILRSLKEIDNQFQSTETEIERLLAERRKLHENKGRLDRQIENIKQTYGVDPRQAANNVPTLTTNIRASRANLERQKRQLESCNSTIRNYQSKLQDVEDKLKGMGTVHGTILEVAETEWKHISMFLEDVCQKVQEKAREELLVKIEERANQYYKKYTEHDTGYKGHVEIGKDYSIASDGGLNASHTVRKKMSVINALLILNQEAMGVHYPFISDNPTASFDRTTAHKYFMSIKDQFDQSIIMTNHIEVGSEPYQELYHQDKIARIYRLESQKHIEDPDNLRELEKWEVSTIVSQLK